MGEKKVSVVMHTLNEEKNIRNCLETVKWADEIILVDMYSDDRTVDIASEYTDKIFFFERLGYADPARKFSLGKTSNEWVLSIDADELVPKKLKDSLSRIMEENLADVVYIPHNNYFFGSLMEGTGWGALQDKHARFYKKGFLNYTDKVHAFIKIDEKARIMEINNPEEGFIHFNYIDAEHFIDKLNRYTTIEAKNLFDEGEDVTSFQLMRRVLGEFKWRYVDLKGYKEGFRGFSLSLMMSMYKLSTYVKLKIMKRYNSQNPREKILEDYQKIADKTILEYNVKLEDIPEKTVPDDFE